MQYKIIHIITALNTGGAEMMLYKLLSNNSNSQFQTEVISLVDIGVVGEKIKKLGIPVMSLNMKRGFPDPRFIMRLSSIIKDKNPDIVQTWMYHADLLGGLATRHARNIPVVWNIRHSNLDPKGNKRMTIWTAKVCAMLSRRVPSRIICCSEASKEVHTEIGYNESKMLVIPNGFELDRFKPDEVVRNKKRDELGIDSSDFVIGHVARYDPQKDHENLIEAASILIKKIKEVNTADFGDVRFLLCGDGVDETNQELVQQINARGLEKYFHLLGRRDDIPELTNAFDLAVSSSSYGEGFPNVLGEAMACEVPCVTTDVGDSALIVGDTGIVVPPKQPEALGQGLGRFLLMEEGQRKNYGISARERIENNFDIHIIAPKYEQLYEEMLNG